MKFRDLFRHFTEWVIVKPKLLNIVKKFNLRAKLDNVVEGKV